MKYKTKNIVGENLQKGGSTIKLVGDTAPKGEKLSIRLVTTSKLAQGGAASRTERLEIFSDTNATMTEIQDYILMMINSPRAIKTNK